MKKYNFTLDFKNGMHADFDLINKWFDLLQVKKRSSHIIGNNKFVYMILDLFSDLMQTIKIPLFSAGKIKETIIDRDKVKIYITVDKINYISKDVYIQVLNISIYLIINHFQKNITYQNKLVVFDYVNNKLIKKFNNISGSGKSTIPFLKAAFKKDIPFEHLGNGIYQLGWGSKSRLFNRSVVDSDSAIGSILSQSKITATQMLKYAGLPSSNHFVATNEKEALKATKVLTYPLVVKPSDMDRGEGVSVDIMDEKGLIKAFNESLRLSLNKRVIIEKQVLGVCHRIFVVKNKLLYAVKRLPISIKGDGIKTISQLIDYENSLQEVFPPWKRTLYFPKDNLSLEILKINDMNFKTILPKGKTVNLRKIESTQWGGIDEDVSSIIHQENVNIAIKAAKIFNLDVAGIDIITEDISQPWFLNDAIINEVNFSPLLGCADISKKAIPRLLDSFFKNNGRISIIVFIGRDSLKKAFEIKKEKFSKNHNIFILSDEGCFNPNGSSLYLNTESYYDSCKALLADKNVETLIISSKTDPFFNGEIPVDKIEDLQIFSNRCNKWEILGKNVLSEDYHSIIRKFLTYSPCLKAGDSGIKQSLPTM